MDIHLILICLLYRIVVCEPQCSKFDYEEKTLEKMIRTEILIEQVVSDIKQLTQQTNDAVETVEKMKTELREGFQNMHSENALKLEEYKNTMQEWKDRLEIKPDVLFLSKDPTTQSPRYNTPIIFGTTMYDMSQSYDNTTGIFTSPVDGMYAFTAQICLNTGNKHIHYTIVANGQYVANSLLHDNIYHFCNTAQAFVVLLKGQTAFVMTRSSTSSPLRKNSDYEWCTFSGILIH
ncbi:hypothetical protein ACF0H5_006751 [Mactra antiquata]